MFRETITQEERQALDRVRGGYVIDHAMLAHLIKRGFVDQLLGGDRISKKGDRALGGLGL